ncbi:ribonuclease H-like domain-containing protein [Tanacetum coccineum]
MLQLSQRLVHFAREMYMQRGHYMERRKRLSFQHQEAGIASEGINGFADMDVGSRNEQLSLNEKLALQANEIHKKDEKLKRYRIIGMKAVKEKEQLHNTVDSWKDSSKNLWRLINYGMSSNDKLGLGFEIQSNDEVLSYEEEMNVFKCSKEDSIGKPSYSRFTKTNDFKGVPHPLSEDYTPKPQEEIDDSFEGSCGNTSEHSFETESESLSVPNEMSTSRLVKSFDKDCDYYEKKMAREAEVKRVFNTGNGVAKPVWTNANRVNHANKFVPRSVQLNAGRPNFNSVRPNINTGRTNINSVRPKVNAVSPKVNTVRSRQPVPHKTSNSVSPKRPQMNQINQRRDFSKSHSSVRRPFAKTTAQMSHSNAVMGSWGSAVKTSASYNWRNSTSQTPYINSGPTFIRTEHPLKNMVDRGIFDSGSMYREHAVTRIKLEDFENFNGDMLPLKVAKTTTDLNKVLFTETECLVVSSDFKMPDENQILLKDETSGILQTFIRQIENQLSHRVKIIRSDNGTEFKNRDMLEFCGNKGIKQEYSNARTPQQNGVAERMNRTLIEAARTMLADSLLPTTFWGKSDKTSKQLGNALVKLVKKVKKLEGFLKRRNMVLSDSEEEEPEAQGRKSQDDPLDSLVQGLVTPSTTKVNASGEEQVEDISPNTLEAAKTLSRVASLKPKSIDKGRRYKRRKETKGKKVQPVLKIYSFSWKGQRAGKAPMIIEETPKKGVMKVFSAENLSFEETKTSKRLKSDEAKDDEPTKKSGKRRKQMARKGLHTDIDKDDSEDSD